MVIASVTDQVLGLHGVALYTIIGLFVFAETGLLIGFIVPGETAAIIGGVAVSRHHALIVTMCVVVCMSAVLGDAVGFLIGRRYGTSVMNSRLVHRRVARVDAAGELLRRRGGTAVFVGRFVAFARTIIPFLAGATRLRYRTFAPYNITGAVVWGIGSVLVGYAAGNSYKKVAGSLGTGTAAILAILIVVGLAGWRIRHHRQARTATNITPPEHDPPGNTHR
jgi:membrane-associated protein